MGCCKCLIGSLFRLILILLNLPLVLAAIAFIFFGIMIAFLFKDLVYWFTVGLNDPETQAVVNNFLAYIDDYALGVGIFLLIFGIVMFVIAFLGACGACCKNFCMIATYASLMGLVTIGTIVAAIIFLVDSSIILGPLQEESLRLIKDHYDDQDNPARAGNISGIDPVAYIYISLFRVLPCCGVTNYTDFQGATKTWYRQYLYTAHPAQNVLLAVVPVMCCKNKFQAPGYINYMYYWPGTSPTLDTSCISNPTSQNSYMDTPCIPYLTQGPDAIFAWVIFGIALSLLVLFIMAVILTVWFKKKGHGHGDNFEMS